MAGTWGYSYTILSFPYDKGEDAIRKAIEQELDCRQEIDGDVSKRNCHAGSIKFHKKKIRKNKEAALAALDKKEAKGKGRAHAFAYKQGKGEKAKIMWLVSAPVTTYTYRDWADR